MTDLVYACAKCGAEYEVFWKAQACCVQITNGNAQACVGATWEHVDKLSSPRTTEELLAERGTRYGPFETHARITQRLLTCVLDPLDVREVNLEADQREALHMICHKLGRIANGDPSYADSWDDIAGYAKLVADRLHRGQEQPLRS